MVRVLNLLEEFLKYRQYTYERLDGATKASDRKEAVFRFCKPSLNKFVMLLSTKAGGLGLNLTAADTGIDRAVPHPHTQLAHSLLHSLPH
jgi:SNF2 family DNA or RNA helicase